MDIKNVLEEEKIITDQIKKHVSLFRPFFELESDVRQYSESLYNFSVTKAHHRRQELIKSKINAKLKRLFGDNYEEDLNFDFDEKLAFNIADHHMVLSHPFLISANIVSSIDKFGLGKKPNPIIVISSGDIPPNNYFSKGGFIFHGKRVPFFSVSEREFTSYYIPKRELNFIEKLKEIKRLDEFNEEEKKFLIAHEELLKSFDFARCENYTDQVALIVRNTWPLLFEEKLRANLPELLYITQEELVTDCLIELLQDDTNIISRCLFEEDFRTRVLNNFRGIVTTWDEQKQKGTHFFWRKYPGQPRSIRMYIEGNKLIPQDERFTQLSVPLGKIAVIDLLKQREIYPSLFTIFSVLNFYAGVKPLTGFGSAVYLELIKQAWLKTLNEMGVHEEVELMEPIATNGLVAGLVLAFKRDAGKVKALYGHDAMFEGGMTKDYLDKVFAMKFKDILRVGVADMYDYFSSKYIPPKEKIAKKIGFDDLSNIVFDWI